MKAIQSTGTLFNDEPIQWGLRGDPYLWRAMREHFASIPMPSSVLEFEQKIASAFEKLTRHTLSSTENFSVKEFAHGGMSSGWIAPEFWRTQALALLKKRYAQAFPAAGPR